MVGGEETSSAEVIKQCRHYVLASYTKFGLGNRKCTKGGVTHLYKNGVALALLFIALSTMNTSSSSIEVVYPPADAKGSRLPSHMLLLKPLRRSRALLASRRPVTEISWWVRQQATRQRRLTPVRAAHQLIKKGEKLEPVKKMPPMVEFDPELFLRPTPYVKNLVDRVLELNAVEANHLCERLRVGLLLFFYRCEVA